MNLEGCAAVVTGGASGLGYITARELAMRCSMVTVIDLPSADAEVAVANLGTNVRFSPADVTSDMDLGAAIASAADYGPLRAVVHCAGRGSPAERILSRAGQMADLQAFAGVLQTNVVGTFNLLRHAARVMSSNNEVDGDRGVVVLTSSIAAFEGQVGQTAYAASKAGVHGMTIVAARDLAIWQIRVNAIAPGVFDTPMLARVGDAARAQLANGIPHPKRLGSPEAFAHMAIALIENDYINGHTVRLDAGLRMS
jgi:NAD(P)-dependent dehydrogenase (short-subunit alcohol dehydrogenase family)